MPSPRHSPKADDDVYDDENRESELEQDELSPAEAGFMEGFEHGVAHVCDACAKRLRPDDAFLEAEVANLPHFFCSEKCLERYKSIYS